MDKELKGIDRYLKNLRIPETDNKTHERKLRKLLSEEINQRPKTRSIFAFPVLKYTLPVAAMLVLIFGLFLVLRGFGGAESAATIVSVRGTVYESTASDAEPGSVLERGEYGEGTIISTEKDSNLAFTVGKNTQVRLMELSRLKIGFLEFKEIEEKSSLFLYKGKIECSVKLPGTTSLFEVLTDYSRIRVCGTRFSVEVSAKGDVVLNVMEGTVQVDNFYKSEEKLERIKTEILTLAGTLDTLFTESKQKVQEKHTLHVSNKEAAVCNKKLEGLLTQLMAVHADAAASDEEKDRGFAKIIDEIKEVVDSDIFIRQGLKRSEEKGVKTESEAEQSEGALGSEAATAEKPVSRTEKTEQTPKKLIYIPMNSGLELGVSVPDGWYKSENADELSWTDEEACGGDLSIKIASSAKRDKVFAWACTITQEVPYDKLLTLKAFVKTDQVTGQGICLTLRADDTLTASGKAEMYATTQGKKIIMGSHDWTEYAVSFAVPLAYEMKSITIYLIFLPETSGTVYFDDITLSYED
jgi:hypothetical protein